MLQRLTNVAVLSLAFISTALAQSVDAPQGFGAVSLQEGGVILPSGRRVTFGLHNPRHGLLPEGDAASTIGFVTGRDSTGDTRYMLFVHRLDDTFGLFPSLNMRPAMAELLGDSIDVAFASTGSITTPLILRLDEERGTLYYRWPLTAQFSGMSGGVPTEGIYNTLLGVGRPVPDLELQGIDGERLGLSEFRGKYLVINWWATYCGPCRLEMPGLNTLVREYRHRSDVAFLAVSPDTLEDLKAFLAESDFAYQQTLVGEDGFSAFGTTWPRNVIVDPSGKVIYDQTGANADEYKEIERVLHDVLSN